MPNVGKILKDEINRLCRRQLRSATEPLRKEVRSLRMQLSALRKQSASLERDLGRRRAAPAPADAAQAAQPEKRERAWVSGAGVKALRNRLGLTQEQFARLISVSTLAVHKWEKQQGKISLRPRSLKALVGARKLGSREARKRLQESK